MSFSAVLVILHGDFYTTDVSGVQMKLGQWVLGFNAFLFIAFGIAALIAPSDLSALVHYGLNSPIAGMEFMATYGGLFIGLGAFMFYCIKNSLQAGLMSVLLSMAGMFSARMYGFLAYGEADSVQYIYLAGESFTVLLVGFILIKYRQELNG